MVTDRHGAELSAYLPRWVAARIGNGAAQKHEAFAERCSGTALFLDLAGFSEITSQLAQLGARGAEDVANLLNDCFSELTEIVLEHGGDIAAFAGDGMLAIWDGPAEEASSRAAHCGLALRHAMSEWALRRASAIGHRIAIEAGEFHYCKLGGVQGRWLYLLLGEPIQRIGAAYRKVARGDLVLCQSAARALAPLCVGEAVDDLMRVTRLRSERPATSRDILEEPASSVLEELLPKILRERVSRGNEAWLGEFRMLTLLEIGFPRLRFDDQLLSALQPAVCEIQRIADRFEGHLVQALMDDKGLRLSLAFGLPPLAHEDDPLRGVEAALTIRRDLAAAGMATSIGIASGRLFCGAYGGRSRRAYGVEGPASNLAALLMEAADGDVVCDPATAQAVGRRVAFTVLRQLHLKGHPPVAAFSPVAIVEFPRTTPVSDMVGRERERAKLRECLDALQSGRASFVVVCGEAGIGKSRLLADLVATAESRGHGILQGAATAVDKSTPYFAWRRPLWQALALKPQADPAVARARLLEEFAGDATRLSWVPLLNAVIPLDLPETDLTGQITGAARAASIEELLVHLLGRRARHPTLLVFEDLHWFDTASLALLNAVARRLPQLLIVASRRSEEALVAPVLAGPERANTLEISLEGLSCESVAELVGRRLHATELPPSLAEFVHHHTSGNPFYCEELVLALRDTGAVTVTRGVCRFSPERPEGSTTARSTSLERAIVSRIDTLPQQGQLLLKVASAIGETFSAELLVGAYPEPLSRDDIIAVLERLTAHDFLRVLERDPSPTYGFRHAISSEVAYSLLSYAQRRTVHKRIATFIETAYAGRLEPFHAQLARHWRRADDLKLAVQYLERAAEQALRNYANFDAIRYVSEAMELTRSMNVSVEQSRRSQWEIILGDAYHELGDFSEASAHYERAMTLSGHRLPTTTGSLVASLCYNAFRQLALRLVNPRPQALPRPARESMQRAAHIYERLGEEYFWLNNSTLVLHATLASLNLAERSGSGPETINAYSALGLGLGMSGLTRAAHFYGHRALRLAETHGGLPELARTELVATVLAYGLGAWVDAERCAEHATTLYRRLGDRARWQNSEAASIFTAILRSDLERAEGLLRGLDATVSAESPVRVRAWALAARVLLDTVRSRPDASALQELRALVEAKQVRTDQLLCLGVIAAGYLRRQDPLHAMEAAERGLGVLGECRDVWGPYVYGAAGVIETLLAEWERLAAEGRALSSPVPGQARTACARLLRFARTSPVCRPHALLLRGRVSFLDRHHRRARRIWRQASIAAEGLGMRHELALALYELGRTSPPGDPRRSSHLARAAEIFEGLGARAELTATRRALSA